MITQTFLAMFKITLKMKLRARDLVQYLHFMLYMLQKTVFIPGISCP